MPKLQLKIIISLFLILSASCVKEVTVREEEEEEKESEYRDPRLWPFSQTSIWNMPIGSDARYVHARLEYGSRMGLGRDEEFISMKPDAPPVKVYYSDALWSTSRDRCVPSDRLLATIPFPHDWIISPETWSGTTPNAGLAVLMPDGETVRQTQPFSHCQYGDVATTNFFEKDVNIYEDGLRGSHGGSGLSTLGGTLRTHELTPTSGPIRHALKISTYGAMNLYYDEETKGYRWPARMADKYAPTSYGTKRMAAPNPECRMGALLALPASMNISDLELETEPAKRIAQALQDYGAYIVDDTAWDIFTIAIEWGPDGRFSDEFEKNWGFRLTHTSSAPTEWSRDLEKIFMSLHVVVNNTPETPGGGGTPRRELAPPFMKK